jgi:hypothetical protein
MKRKVTNLIFYPCHQFVCYTRKKKIALNRVYIGFKKHTTVKVKGGTSKRHCELSRKNMVESKL